MTAPLDEICASCSRKPCTTLPNPRFMGCIGVLDNPHEAPHNCPLAITGQRQLSFALFGLNDMALRRLCDEATQSARVLFGSAPRSPGQAEAYLGQLMEQGRIRMLAISPGQAIPAHLVRSPAKPAPKKSVAEQVAEIIEEAPPPPPKEEKKVRTPIHIIEVPDLLFSLGSPVPALDDKGWLVGALATAVLYAKDEGAERQERLIVCGHADTTGEPPRNYEIAEQRAQMVKALLDQNVEAWKTLANKHGKVRDYQQTLKSLATAHGWSCDPGKIDNAKGPQTEAAVKAFQQECNDRYNMGLTVDGDVGPKTWSAIHRTLCALVCEHLDIAGTAEPAPPKWLKPIYGFPAGQGIYSCGESFPVAAVGRNDVASEADRRVELVFAPKDLEVKGAVNKYVNMKPEECVLYDTARIAHEPVPRTPSASDSIQMGDMFWDFFQEHFPGKDDAEVFDRFIRSVYGMVPNASKMEELRGTIKAKSLRKPDSFVVTRMRCDQLGAYGDKVMYLSQRLVLDAEYLPGARWLLLLTLLHEAGHFLDDVISCDYADSCSDTPGEEGGAFCERYVAHSYQQLLEESYAYADATSTGDGRAVISNFEMNVDGFSSEERARRFWLSIGNLRNTEGSLGLLNGNTVNVEFWTVYFIGAAHELMTKTAANAVGIEYDDNLDDGCAWPDIPQENDPDNAHTNYVKFGWVYLNKKHPNMVLFKFAKSIFSGSEFKQSMVYNSHFANRQYWHSMCPVEENNGKPIAIQLNNGQVKEKILNQLKDWYIKALQQKSLGPKAMDKSVAAKGLFHLGKMLHTVQDSYALSHAWRRFECDYENEFWDGIPTSIRPNGNILDKINSSGNWLIWSFQTYTEQDGDFHGLADQEFAIGYAQALEASKRILRFYKSDTEWELVKDYLDKEVYRLHPDREQATSGESHPWFKKKLDDGEQRNDNNITAKILLLKDKVCANDISISQAEAERAKSEQRMIGYTTYLALGQYHHPVKAYR